MRTGHRHWWSCDHIENMYRPEQFFIGEQGSDVLKRKSEKVKKQKAKSGKRKAEKRKAIGFLAHAVVSWRFVIGRRAQGCG